MTSDTTLRLSVSHHTGYAYDPPAMRLALRLRLFPSEHAAQKVENWRVTVNDTPITALVRDGFGDQIALWTSVEPVESLEIEAAGVVETQDAAGMLTGMASRPPPALYLRKTKATMPNDAILELAENCRRPNDLDQLHALSELVRDRVEYRSKSTNSDTTASEALEQGAGVCQDHAHLFISGARTLGVPARYVVGYLMSDMAAEGDAEQAMIRASHAWAEAYAEGVGWVGFDPANRLCPTGRYIRLCSGLDADHAAPIRGAMTGDSKVALNASVDIALAQQ